MTQALWQLGAAALSRAYSCGDLSPCEVLTSVLSRIDAVNPQLNALIAANTDDATAAARLSEARWRRDEPLSPLDGVPLSIKDSIPMRGLPCTWGSALYRDWVPSRDELPVVRVRAAGMLLLGKTNVPEFTVQGTTHNLVFGTTRNPWNTSLTPGGSSGGAVAAVASGMGPLALATDGGGSIRRPAGHTGLVGMKPGLGRVARSDGLPAILLDFEVIGPIGRSVEDVVALLDIIAHPHPNDPRSSRQADQPFVPPARVPRQRILHVRTIGGAPVASEIDNAVGAVAARLAALGHEVETRESFDLPCVLNDAVWPVLSQSGVAWLLRRHVGWQGRIGAPLQAMAEAGAALTAADLLQALTDVAELQKDLQALMSGHDIVLTPTAAAMPWPAAETHPTTIAGQPVGRRGHAVFTAFVNAAGLPAIALPALTETQHTGALPIGFQLIGRQGGDELLCALAAEYEAAHPWAGRWPELG